MTNYITGMYTHAYTICPHFFIASVHVTHTHRHTHTYAHIHTYIHTHTHTDVSRLALITVLGTYFMYSTILYTPTNFLACCAG